MADDQRLRRRGLLTLAAVAASAAACSRTAPVTPAAPPSGLPAMSEVPMVAPTSAAPSPSPSKSVAPAATPAATQEPEAQPIAVRKGGPVPALDRVMLGSYLDLGGMSLRESLALRRRQLGREQRIVHQFLGWAERMPTAAPDIGDATLMVSWHGTKTAAVAGGAQDAVIEAAARRLSAYRKPLLLRWAWEMNGDWFEWGGAKNGRDPGLYVTAYRRIHRIFRAAGADNVAFVWSPNWNSSPGASWNAMSRYYPGDSYVDWVGVSGYNFYSESPSTLFRPVVSAYGKKKPVMLTETAAIDHGGTSKAVWINQLSRYVRGTPAIGAVVWFDTDVQHDSDHNFRFDSSSSSLAAYRTMARSARFSG